MKLKHACAPRAKAFEKQNTFAHLAQGFGKIKSRLRTSRKALKKLNRVCAPRARL
jgi:hypothetical protein